MMEKALQLTCYNTERPDPISAISIPQQLSFHDFPFLSALSLLNKALFAHPCPLQQVELYDGVKEYMTFFFMFQFC